MKEVKIKRVGIIFSSLIILTIIVHLLVLIKVLPYEWVNGGRSLSYQEASITSATSIFVLIVIGLISLIASGNINVKLSRMSVLAVQVASWIFVVYFALTCIMQFLGTPFEKYFMSIVCLLLTIAAFEIVYWRDWKNWK